MQELKRKLNVLLLTIIVHLIVIIALLILKISVSYEDNPPISYMELDFLEEKAEELEKESESMKEEINIDEYISNLKNTGMAAGLNKQSSYSQNNSDEMSEAELKAKYESDFLKEKYGENRSNSGYSEKDEYDDVKIDRTPKNNYKTNTKNENTGYSGPSLVFVDLENKNRGKRYIEVPVFTCMEEGRVVINITINPQGSVVSTSLGSVSSKASDKSCIVDAAKKAAANSKFSSIIGGKTEKGKITYTFIKQ